jgi:thymidine kinase
MLKHLDLLLDLLNLEEEERQSFLAIGQVIAHHTNKKLLIHHRMGVVFQSRYALLLEKITLEEFLAVGDVSSTRPLWEKEEVKVSSLELLQSQKKLNDLEENSMLLVDEISFLSLDKKEQEEVQELLERKQILLLVC